jgi:hypothetical protein
LLTVSSVLYQEPNGLLSVYLCSKAKALDSVRSAAFASCSSGI